MASLFTTETPVGTDNSDGTPGISTATTLRFDADGTVTAIRFYATTTVSGTYTAALYQVTGADVPGPGTGTLLGSKVGGTPTGGTWNTITLDTPIAVTAGVLYRATLHNTAGRYVNTNGVFVSPLTNGHITADEDGSNPTGLGTLTQGTYKIDAALNYPRDAGTQANYFIDVDYTPTTETGTAAIVFPALAAAATGTASAEATADVTFPAFTAAVVGGPATLAVAALILPSLTAAAAGTVTGAGTAAIVLPAFTAAATGTVADPASYDDPEILISRWLQATTGIKTWADPRLDPMWRFTAAIAHIQRGQSLTPTPISLDDVTLDVDVYAAAADHARAAAARIQSALEFQLPLTTFPNGIFCKAVFAVSRPSWAPDPQVYRRSAAYRIILHGLVES